LISVSTLLVVSGLAELLTPSRQNEHLTDRPLPHYFFTCSGFPTEVKPVPQKI
jgi:hypothetical protein